MVCAYMQGEWDSRGGVGGRVGPRNELGFACVTRCGAI
jgi:hypothetical protein